MFVFTDVYSASSDELWVFLPVMGYEFCLRTEAVMTSPRIELLWLLCDYAYKSYIILIARDDIVEQSKWNITTRTCQTCPGRDKKPSPTLRLIIRRMTTCFTCRPMRRLSTCPKAQDTSPAFSCSLKLWKKALVMQ